MIAFKMKSLYFLLIFSLFAPATGSLADAIYLKDGKEVKGIVVEEYADRVVISTYEGEQMLPKSDIDNIEYDFVEQNLVKLGDRYKERHEFEKAYFYYEKAIKTNPDYKVARERMNYSM